jgi:hypothetical protein
LESFYGAPGDDYFVSLDCQLSSQQRSEYQDRITIYLFVSFNSTNAFKPMSIVFPIAAS